MFGLCFHTGVVAAALRITLSDDYIFPILDALTLGPHVLYPNFEGFKICADFPALMTFLCTHFCVRNEQIIPKNVQNWGMISTVGSTSQCIFVHNSNLICIPNALPLSPLLSRCRWLIQLQTQKLAGCLNFFLFFFDEIIRDDVWHLLRI